MQQLKSIKMTLEVSSFFKTHEVGNRGGGEGAFWVGGGRWEGGEQGWW